MDTSFLIVNLALAIVLVAIVSIAMFTVPNIGRLQSSA